MVGAIKFLGKICQIIKNFQCQFVNTQHKRKPLYYYRGAGNR
jgi:hypothetical protein